MRVQAGWDWGMTGWSLTWRGPRRSGGMKPAQSAQRLFHLPGPISGPSSGRSAGPLPERASALARGHRHAWRLVNPAAPVRAGAFAPAPGGQARLDLARAKSSKKTGAVRVTGRMGFWGTQSGQDTDSVEE